jgi:transcriptional regulator with XRE-family HTH domain
MENKLFEPNRLQEILDKEGLTQTKLAKLTEDIAERISSGTINKICTNRNPVSNRHKYIIVKVLNKYVGQEKYSVSSIF